MNQKEELEYHLRNSLREKIESYFDSIDRFEGQFILNSEIVKDSPYEGKDLISNLQLELPSQGELMEVVLGDRNQIVIQGILKVATSSQIPKKGPSLNMWSQSLFSIQGVATVSYDPNSKRIEVSTLSIS
tara:strand:- start:10975 stop:11364 length:390 start_codon:yes stop_codon:yes gene_type:complete